MEGGMVVDLTQDSWEVGNLGYLRHEYHQRRGTVTRMVYGPQTLEENVRAVKSEFAVCRLLGAPLDIVRSLGADPGYDLVHRGWQIEVKYTIYKTGKLVYNPEVHPNFSQDIWVLTIVSDDSFEVKVPGWVWRDEMSGRWYVCRDLNDKFDEGAFCIHQHQLEKASELISLRERIFARKEVQLRLW